LRDEPRDWEEVWGIEGVWRARYLDKRGDIREYRHWWSTILWVDGEYKEPNEWVIKDNIRDVVDKEEEQNQRITRQALPQDPQKADREWVWDNRGDLQWEEDNSEEKT
jgi:hypothetical protein